MLSVGIKGRRACAGATALGVVAALIVAGCGGGSTVTDKSGNAGGAATSGGSGAASGSKPALSIGLPYGPTSLNPALNNTGLSTILLSLTNTPLFRQGSGFDIGPGLATSWKYVGKDDTVFQFKVRSGVKFSDGSRLDAQAVKAWLDYFVNANGPFAAALPIKSIQAIGASTVRIQLTSPDPTLPLKLSEYSNAGYVSSVKDPKALATATAGAGPYVIDTSQTQSGSQYTLVPNKTYYDQSAIRFSKVTVKIIASPTSMLQALQAGQLDAASIDSSVVEGLKNPEFTVVRTPGQVAVIDVIDRNGSVTKPLGDLRVRQALNYAVNREVIAKALGGPGAVPTSQLLTDFADPAMNDYYSYDPAKAKALLAAAGYPNGFTLNLIDGGSLYGNAGNPVSQAVAKDWAAIGVNVKITSAATADQLVQQSLSRKYALSELTFTNLSTLYLYNLVLAPKGSLNPFHADNPDIDKAVRAALVSQGSKEAAAFREVNDLIVKDAVFVPVFSFPALWAVSTHIRGLNEESLQPFPSEWSWSE